MGSLPENQLTERDTTVTPVSPGPAKPPPKPEEYRRLGRRAFGRYELLIEMGKGGMATLFLARLSGPQNFEKLLAIKKIHDHLTDEGDFVNMFLDEARLSALIQHPNVATIFDMGQIESSYFIAMEYVHGQNLTDIIKVALHNPGIFSWEHACRMVADAAAGLHAAHELKRKDGSSLGVVHRDVSPQNILVSYDGHVKVVDFGIAFAAGRVSKTKAGTLKGKLGYMAPEMTTSAPVDRRADIFSLGIVLFELCTLRRLFRGSSDAETIMLVRDAEIPKPRDVNDDIPAGLERILLKTLQADPDDRYATAEQLGEELDAFLVNHKKSMSRSKMTALLDQLFYDRRRIKDEQIKRAMDEPTTDPLKGVGMGATTDNSLVVPTVVPPGRPRLWYGLGGGGALVLAVAVVLFFALREKPEKKSAESRSAKPAPMESMRPAQRPTGATIHVDVEPAVPGIAVLFRGQRYPGPRFKVAVARSNKAERLVVQAPGHQEESVVVVPLADSRVKVQLRKAPVARLPPMDAPMARPAKRVRPRPKHRRRRRRRPRPMGGLRDFPD